jgi:signal transduction histidine kinase
MSWRAPVAVTLTGAATTLLASLGLKGSLSEAATLAAVAGGAAACVGVAGTALLYVARRRSIAVQSALIALTSVAAVAAGAMAASHMMMGASEPVAALGVVIASSGTIGVLISLVLGARLRTGSESLIAAARQIGEGDLATPVAEPPAEEFAALARELHAMQAQLEASALRERHVEEARRELVAWVSHDLRTPLARIRAIVEALEDGVVVDAAEVSSFYARLRAEADRLGRLISDLFELNRIAAGALELELERVRVGDVVSDVVSSFSVLADARQITLTAEQPQLDPTVEISPPHLERALENLLDNALRYTSERGAVDVRLVRQNGRVSVDIEDSCGGVDVEELERLVAEPRVPRARAGQGGLGLGLAIAKGLVEAQGGELVVAATDRGCRFSLRLPLSDGR